MLTASQSRSLAESFERAIDAVRSFESQKANGSPACEDPTNSRLDDLVFQMLCEEFSIRAFRLLLGSLTDPSEEAALENLPEGPRPQHS